MVFNANLIDQCLVGSYDSGAGVPVSQPFLLPCIFAKTAQILTTNMKSISGCNWDVTKSTKYVISGFYYGVSSVPERIRPRTQTNALRELYKLRGELKRDDL